MKKKPFEVSFMRLQRSFPKLVKQRTSQSCKTSPVQLFLPSEILLIIFRCLMEDAYADVLRYDFTHSFSLYAWRLNDVTGVDVGQASLLSAIQVCRQWYHAGTAILYTRPFLLSSERVHQFVRSLSTSPDLALLVRGVFVLGEKAPEVQDSLFPKRKERRRQDTMRASRDALMEALRSCESLETFVASSGDFDHPVPGFCFDKQLQDLSGLACNLKRLMLYDCSITLGQGEPVEYPPLPCLEILSFRAVRFQDPFPIPHLPRLHTLQISDSNFGQDHEPLHLSALNLPSLTTLELYTNHMTFTLGWALSRNLQRFHSVRSSVCSYGPMPNLRHAAVHLYYDAELKPRSSAEALAQNVGALETLTIVLSSNEVSLDSTDCARQFFDDVVKLSQSDKLREILLLSHKAKLPMGRKTGETSPPMAKKIARHCKLRGIRLRVQAGHANRWIGQNISSPFGLSPSSSKETRDSRDKTRMKALLLID